MKINTVGAFIKYNDSFLLLQRKTLDWGLVGGKIDAEESNEEGLIREIKEEIGFDASKEKINSLGEFNLVPSNNDIVFHAYEIILDTQISPILNTDENPNFRWVTREECEQMKDLMPELYILLDKMNKT